MSDFRDKVVVLRLMNVGHRCFDVRLLAAPFPWLLIQCILSQFHPLSPGLTI